MKLCTTTSTLSRTFGLDKGLDIISRSGFDGLDFSFFEYPQDKGVFTYDDTAFRTYWEETKRKCDSLGLFVNQTHSHMISYITDSSKKEHVLDMQIRAIKATAYLGAKYCIVHPGIFPDCRYSFLRKEEKEHNMMFYGELVPYLKEYGVKIAIENMFNWDPEKKCTCPCVCSEPEEMADYIDTMGENFVACLDIGHSVLSEQTPDRMIRVLGDRLLTLHVHDNDGISDKHTLPYFGGKIDWNAVCAALKEIKFKGNFSFEADAFMWNIPDPLKPDASAYMEKTGRYLVSLIEN